MSHFQDSWNWKLGNQSGSQILYNWNQNENNWSSNAVQGGCLHLAKSKIAARLCLVVLLGFSYKKHVTNVTNMPLNMLSPLRPSLHADVNIPWQSYKATHCEPGTRRWCLSGLGLEKVPSDNVFCKIWHRFLMVFRQIETEFSPCLPHAFRILRHRDVVTLSSPIRCPRSWPLGFNKLPSWQYAWHSLGIKDNKRW